MTTRILDARASDFRAMDRPALLESIRKAEGRTVAAEIVVSYSPLVDGVTNAELAAAFGADLVILNLYDVQSPGVEGAPSSGATPGAIKHLTGRPVGINLEPVPDHSPLSPGRRANAANAAAALDQGADFVVLTGNPGTGVSNELIARRVAEAVRAVGGQIPVFAGKMHGAGVAAEEGTGIASPSGIDAFLEAGADVILLPAPGTVPGITIEDIRELVRRVHSKGGLVMVTIGTSQEGADEQTIRRLAIDAKMTGADIYHIGDAGYHGIAIPENIMAYSIALRGRRHTYRRMALSVNR